VNKIEDASRCILSLTRGKDSHCHRVYGKKRTWAVG
jgi:hypothetical protein